MKFATNIDLLKNELLNGVLQNLAVDPDTSSSKAGQVYFNTTDNVFKYFNGEEWISPTDIDIVDVEHGGTGVTELTNGEVLVGNGTDPVTTVAIDDEVTADSSNLITSDAVYEYVESVRIEIEAGEVTLDDEVTEDSSNGVKSSGIYTFVEGVEEEITEAYEEYVETYIDEHTDKSIIEGGSDNLVTSEAVVGYVDSVADDINTTLEETYATIEYVDEQIEEVEKLIPTVVDTVEEGSEDAVTGDGIYNFVTDEIRGAFEEKVTDTVEEDSDLLPTSDAVYSFTTKAISDGFKVAEVMRFMGTVEATGDGGTVINASGSDANEINGKALDSLNSYEIGWTFQVISDLPDKFYTIDPDTGNIIKIKSGDMIIVLQDSSTYSNEIIDVLQSNLDGVVIGPESAVDGNFAVFSGTSGKMIIDSGLSVMDTVTGVVSFNLGDSNTVSLTSNNADDNKVVGVGSVITADLIDTGVVAGEYGDAIDAETISNGEVLTVPYFTVDAQGRLTIAGVNNLTLDIQTSQTYETDNPALVLSNGSCTWTVNHGLDAKYPSVTLYYIGDGEKELAMADVVATDDNTVTITINSSTNITAGNYHVVVRS